VPLISAGGALNLIAIVANGGVMPASEAALRRAGLDAEAGFSNSAHVADARVAWLGDVFAVPASWPLSNVFSIGDVVVVAGIGYLVWRQCRPAAAAEASGDTGAEATADVRAAATDGTVGGAQGRSSESRTH
jgi:hypothetical protein